MQIEPLKEELRKLPLDTLQSLFDEIITQKKIEQRERQRYHECMVKFHSLLSNLCYVAERQKKRLALFDAIGCEVDGKYVSSVVDQMTVAQLLHSKSIAHSQRQSRPIEETSEFQKELKAFYSRAGAKAYEMNNQVAVKRRLERYYEELQKYYGKFGKRVCEPKFFNVIFNGLVAKELVPYSKGKNDILSDLQWLANV